jgi:hypothetical protein
MAYYVISSTGEAMSRTSMQQVTRQESEMTDNKMLFQEFDADIWHQLQDNDFPDKDNKLNPEDGWAEFSEHDEDFMEEFNKVINAEAIGEADDEFIP